MTWNVPVEGNAEGRRAVIDDVVPTVGAYQQVALRRSKCLVEPDERPCLRESFNEGNVECRPRQPTQFWMSSSAWWRLRYRPGESPCSRLKAAAKANGEE